MQRIGIIAAGEERPWRRKKWYEFWKQQKDYDFINNEEMQIESAIVYLPNEDWALDEVPRELIDTWLDKAGEFFEEQGIVNVVCTRSVRDVVGKEVNVWGVKVYNGVELLRSLAPKILRQIAKVKGVQGGSLVYSDDRITGENDRIIKKMCRQCRYVTIISDDKSGADRLASRLFDEFGLVADVRAPNDGYVDCDFVVAAGGKLPAIPKRAVVVDVSGGKIECKNEVQVDWVSVNSNDLRLPYDVDSLELAELLSESREFSEYKITKLYYKGKRVKFH